MSYDVEDSQKGYRFTPWEWIAGLSKGQIARFDRPEEREQSKERTIKLIEQGRIVPFGGRPYGNGRGPTPSEAKLYSLLQGEGFELQVIVQTNRTKPTHYKLDLGHRTAKIAIELDGSSHRGNARKNSDASKDSFLMSQDWQVLRFQEPVDCEEAARKCVEALSIRSARCGT